MPPSKANAIGLVTPVRVPADRARPAGDAPGQASGRAAGGEPVQGTAADQRPIPSGPPPRTAKSKIRRQEREFLPAALEILETPANPAGRWTALTVAAMFTIAITWSIVGKIDIVAVAQGRVVPVGGTKVVQPREIASVRAIHVADGQHVKAGELLVELDSTESEVDIGQLQRERGEAGIEASRLIAFIDAVGGKPGDFAPRVTDVDLAVVQMHRSRLQSDLAAFEAELAVLQAELSRRAADRSAIKAQVAKLSEMIPLLADREATVYKLMNQGHTPKPVWQQAKTQLIEARHDLKIQKHRLAEAESSLNAAKKERNRMIADTLRQAYSELAEARKTFAQSDLSLRKALNREGLKKLRAPVTGTVQQVSVYTIGGVVQPAEPLLAIVPDDAELEVRAQVLNKDKGVIFNGQAAEIKLESFNFTRYGTIDGEVVSVSNDAVENQQLGLVYEARVAMAARTIRAEGKDVALTPGMAVTVEIKTGKRRIIEFLLSPLQRYQDEAIRER